MHAISIERYQARRRRNTFKVFSMAALLVVVLLSVFVALFVNSGPIILGTEMNTNGLVEYLCIGNGCEDLTDMDW